MKSVFASLLALAFVLSLPGAAFAESGSSNGESGNNAVVTSTVRTCMASAIATRESAVQGAWSTFNTSVSSAYATRASALASAWSGDKTRAQIKIEVKAAWKAFKTSIKNARKALKDARKSAWSTFKTAAKACKAPGDTVESTEAKSEV